MQDEIVRVWWSQVQESGRIIVDFIYTVWLDQGWLLNDTRAVHAWCFTITSKDFQIHEGDMWQRFHQNVADQTLTALLFNGLVSCDTHGQDLREECGPIIWVF